MPEISVVMPVYNGEKYIKETIDSILNQSFTDFEFVIVNDGSTDKTRAIIESYNDGRIKLYNLEENRGVGYASNYSIHKAIGKYIARADADDIYHPDRLYLQKKYLDENPNIALVKSLYEYFPDVDLKDIEKFNSMKCITEKDKNSVITSEEISEKLYWDMCIPNPSIMVRADVIKMFGYEDMRVGEDYYLFYQMNKMGYRMGTVTKTLLSVRVSDESLTSNKYEICESRYLVKRHIIDPLFIGGDVYIWGTGGLGKMVFEVLTTRGFKIAGFIDSDSTKSGKELFGLEIYTPKLVLKKGNVKIIVASQPGKYEISRVLENEGYRHLRDYVVYS